MGGASGTEAAASDGWRKLGQISRACFFRFHLNVACERREGGEDEARRSGSTEAAQSGTLLGHDITPAPPLRASGRNKLRSPRSWGGRQQASQTHLLCHRPSQVAFNCRARTLDSAAHITRSSEGLTGPPGSRSLPLEPARRQVSCRLPSDRVANPRSCSRRHALLANQRSPKRRTQQVPKEPEPTSALRQRARKQFELARLERAGRDIGSGDWRGTGGF